MTALRSFAGASSTVTAAATMLLGLLLAPGLRAQASVEAETARPSVGQTFFGPQRGSAGRSGPDRWGVPRLESARADHRPERRRRTVPVNVNSLANGTANQPISGPDLRHQRPRSRTAPATTLIQVNNQVTVVNASMPSAEPRRAVRRGEALRDREEARTEDPEPGGPAPTSASAESTSEPVPRQWAPLVKPLAPAEEAGEIDVRNCAVVRITTAGGIEWRHRVALDALGASSVAGAASLLQARLRTDRPLLVTSRDGRVRVPARLVESLIVGPCR